MIDWEDFWEQMRIGFSVLLMVAVLLAAVVGPILMLGYWGIPISGMLFVTISSLVHSVWLS